MLKRVIAGIVLSVVLWGAGAGVAQPQPEERGFIIRVMDKDRMIYIDLGRRDDVQQGDLYDIVAADVLSNPLSGDTLAVSSTRVGALRVRQVFEKMSVAELLYLEPGVDPMMMRITPARAERLAELEDYLRHPAQRQGAASSRLVMLVPGLPQYRQGQHRKGLALMTAEVASLAAGIGYRLSSNDWHDQYRKLPAGLPADQYDHYFSEANTRRNRSNRLFYLTGALYAYHFVDLLWAPQGFLSRLGVPTPGLEVGWSACRDRAPVLQLRRHF